MSTEIIQFIRLARQAEKIADSDASWEDKFHLIFPDISEQIWKLKLGFDYCDPDADYVDDVLAFVNALKSKADELEAEFPEALSATVIEHAVIVVNMFDQANTAKAIELLGNRGLILKQAVSDLRRVLNADEQRTILVEEQT